MEMRALLRNVLSSIRQQGKIFFGTSRKDTAKSIEHEHLPPVALSLLQTGSFEFRHIGRPVDKRIRHRNAVQAGCCTIASYV